MNGRVGSAVSALCGRAQAAPGFEVGNLRLFLGFLSMERVFTILSLCSSLTSNRRHVEASEHV